MRGFVLVLSFARPGQEVTASGSQPDGNSIVRNRASAERGMQVASAAIGDARAFSQKITALWEDWVLGTIGNKRVDIELLRLLPAAWNFPDLLQWGISAGFPL